MVIIKKTTERLPKCRFFLGGGSIFNINSVKYNMIIDPKFTFLLQ